MSRAPISQAQSYAAYSHISSQPQQPVHGQIPQASAPDFAAWGLDNATAQFGMQLGQNAVAAGQDYVQKNVRSVSILFIIGDPVEVAIVARGLDTNKRGQASL